MSGRVHAVAQPGDAPPLEHLIWHFLALVVQPIPTRSLGDAFILTLAVGIWHPRLVAVRFRPPAPALCQFNSGAVWCCSAQLLLPLAFGETSPRSVYISKG